MDKIRHLLYKQMIYITNYYNEMLSISQAAEAIGVSTKTIRRWDATNKLQSVRLASGHRRFTAQQINEFATKPSDGFKHVIYCRVSSRKQKHDLQRQIAYMRSKYPKHEIISEIASGIHYDRQGIRQILEYIKNKQLKSLVVAHKDRLTRFSFDIWQHLAEIHGFKLIVENNENESPETEIVKDIIAIVTSFAARIHGLRKYIPRKSKIIKEWITDANFYYNKTLDYLSQSTKVTKFKLRDIIKQKYQSIKSNVPNTAIEYSIFNALDAFKKTKDKANLKYKSNHDVSITMYIDGRCIKNGFIYKENFIKKLKKQNPKLANETDKKYRIRINELSEKSKIMTDDLLTNKCCVVQYNKQSNKIYLFKPIECENEKLKKRHDIVSIDIGANPFLAFYSKRKCGMVDGEWSAKIKYIFKKQDKLQSKLNKMQKKKDNFYERSNVKKQLGTTKEKVKNIVNNVHWQTINYFTKKYNTIILPKTNMKGIIGTLPSKAARIIQSYGHYNYRQKMIHKCQERNVKLLLCKEIYTSKTCSWCGNIKEDLGTAKVYKCKKCDLKIHRDINGARNIMLRPLMLGLASPELNQH